MKRTQTRSDRWFDVLLETDGAQAAVMTLAPGDATGGPNNKLYVVAGEGHATVERETVTLTAGDLVVIEADETHEIEATSSDPLGTLTLYVPPEY